MAVSYLNEGATSFAAANWSDGVGFAAASTNVINYPGTQSITGALDQSAVSIESLDTYPPFAGNIGAAGNPLIIDVDGTIYSEANQVSRVRLLQSGGRAYLNFGGGNTLCHILVVGGGVECFHVAGILNFLSVEGGGRYVGNQTVTYGDTGRIDLNGGTSFIDLHASDLCPSINVNAGYHIIRRGGVAATGRLTVNGGTVLLDSLGVAWPEVYVEGGTLIWQSSGAPDTNAGDVTLRGGTVDFSNLNRALTLTSARIYGGVNIKGKDHKLLTLTTPLYQGGGGSGLGHP